MKFEGAQTIQTQLCSAFAAGEKADIIFGCLGFAIYLFIYLVVPGLSSGRWAP